MFKGALFLVLIFLSVIINGGSAGAQLQEKGQSSEQVLTYDQTEGDNVSRETPRPYTGDIEEYPDSGLGTTLRENATDDQDLQSYPDPDYPFADPGMTEVPITDSAGPDNTLKETPTTDSAGPDTTLREKATDDSGVQEPASPYGPVPDLFAPKKNVGSGA